MSSERVLAIDPGDSRTGWATAVLRENSMKYLTHGVQNHREFGEGLHRDYASGHGNHYDVLVYETWLPRPIDGSMAWIQGNQLLAAQLIGQIRLAGWLYGPKLKGQSPSAKRTAVAQMGKRAPGLVERMSQCHEQHDQDAIMHLWSYFWANWVSDPENLTID